ncbi:unnamed protein product [Urochloa humidicola]
MPPGEGSFPGSLRDVLDLPMRRKLEGLPGASFDIQIYDMWMKAWNTLREQKNAKFCVDSNSDDECHIPEEKMLPKEDQQLAFCRDDPQLQAKGANVKSWACVNFSSIGGEELVRFLHSLSRTCVDIGMDFGLEPTILVCKSSPCLADIDHGLLIVHEFFGTEMEKDSTKFILVILPDTRCFDEKVEETCKDDGVAYKCCLPLYDRMGNEKYLQNAATEIKAKVIEFNELSDSRKDMDLDGIFDETDSEEDDGYDYKDEREYGFDIEMREDDCYNSEERKGADYGEMRDDDGCNYEEREDDAHDPHNELGRVSRMRVLKMSRRLLFPYDTPMTEGKSWNIKTWACVNFSSIKGKGLFRFFSKLGNMCMSIGMDLSLEPAMLIHKKSTDKNDIADSLWIVFEFFRHLKIEKRATFLLVILPEATYAHASVQTVCENLRFVYQFCPPSHARRASEKYLKNAANKIKAKVHGHSDYFGDMSEDSSDSGTAEGASEDSDEDMGVHLNSWNMVVRGNEIFEDLSDSNEKTTEEEHGYDEELNYASLERKGEPRLSVA